MEYDELNKYFMIINNRIYCEYFKLYKIIIEYLNKNIKEPKLMDMTKTINRFPVYKDLEPYKQYDIQIISDIHEQIILLLTGFDIFITNKETVLKGHVEKKNIGFNLDNFVNTYNYDITIIREKLSLFLDYIDFFHRIHSKYLNTFSEKLNLMISELNRDIHPDATYEESVVETLVVEEPAVDEETETVIVKEETVVEEEIVVEEVVIEEEIVVEEAVVEEVVVEEAVVEEVVIEEEIVVEEDAIVIEEPIVEELHTTSNKDTIIEQLMKEAIIDYKENNNLLPEEITTIKKSINNLKLTVIVEEITDETSIKSIEETDFQEVVHVEEPIVGEVLLEDPVLEEVVVGEAVVVEEVLLEESVIEEEESEDSEESVIEEEDSEETIVQNDEEILSELSISETNEEASNSSTSSEEMLR
jgi:hypothetical protein